MKVISNSSPLINFGTLGRLDILQTLYRNLFIPEAVYHEVVVAGQRHPGAAAIREIGYLQTRIGFRIGTDLKARVLQEAGE